MLIRLVSCLTVLIVTNQLCAADKDHLQRGEPVLETTDLVKYHRRVRQILSRGWRSDVVLRTVAYPPWEPEAVIGLYHQRGHYYAFAIRPSKQIWEAGLGFGESDAILQKRLSPLRPVFHSRVISDALAARIATLYRHVLNDSHNYSKDESVYLDTSSDTFYLAFAPNERIVANIVGWGRNTEQLLWVNEMLMSYSLGKAPEAKLEAEVSKRERKLGL